MKMGGYSPSNGRYGVHNCGYGWKLDGREVEKVSIADKLEGKPDKTEGVLR